MPGRFTVFLIILFFAGMVTLQSLKHIAFHGDSAPQLKPSLELAAQDGITSWKLYANNIELGVAVSQVQKTKSGVYNLRQRINLNGDLQTFLGPLVTLALKRFHIQLTDLMIVFGTDMELTYLGTMRTLRLTFLARPKPISTSPSAKETQKSLSDDDKENVNNLLHLFIEGVVEADHLNFHGFLALAGQKINIDNYQMRHHSRDILLSTLAPTDCMAGLYRGQRWQTAVIDPTELMTNSLTQSKAKELASGVLDTDEFVKKRLTEVRVLDEFKELEWHNVKVRCFVVQSQDRGAKISAWVDATSFRVLRQVAEWPGNTIELIRDPKTDDE